MVVLKGYEAQDFELFYGLCCIGESTRSDRACALVDRPPGGGLCKHVAAHDFSFSMERQSPIGEGDTSHNKDDWKPLS